MLLGRRAGVDHFASRIPDLEDGDRVELTHVLATLFEGGRAAHDAAGRDRAVRIDQVLQRHVGATDGERGSVATLRVQRDEPGATHQRERVLQACELQGADGGNVQ